MTTARSQALIFAATTTDGQSLQFTCPPNTVTLLKSAALLNAGGASTRVVIGVVNPALSVTINLFDQSVAPNTPASWTGWYALNPGMKVTVYGAVHPVSAIVTGAVLTGANPFPPNV